MAQRSQSCSFTVCKNLKPMKTSYLFMLCLSLNCAFAQRPNIIYIMTDDMGYGDLSCYRAANAPPLPFRTPNLDKLAAQGIKFINAYAAAPVCTPTRTALMTGRYPARTPVGLMEPLAHKRRDSTYGLTPAYPSLATLIKAAGYETVLIGKWHLGFRPDQSPNANGFDYSFGISSGGADYVSHKGEKHDHDLFENGKPVHPQGYMTDLFTQKAVDFLQQPHTKPFFLALTYTAPHWPWQGPNDAPYAAKTRYTEGGSAEIYAQMMQRLDESIGQVMQTLDEQKLTNNTLVIFTNDNGGERYSDNGGLSNSKMTLWEGGIRVPAFVRWPGKIKPGTTTPQVAVTMDWTATMLAIAGAKPHANFPLDGIDLMPVCQGKRKPIERTLFWRTFQRTQQKAVRIGRWKYLNDEKGEYLFDLATDEGEKQDLKASQPKRFDQLKQKYADWEKTVLEPVAL